MVDFRPEATLGIFCAITLFGFVRSQLSECKPHLLSVYLTVSDCQYLCPIPRGIEGYLLCKADGHTAVACSKSNQVEQFPDPQDNFQTQKCTWVVCNIIRSHPCHNNPSPIYREIRYLYAQVSNETRGNVPVYIQPATKPNNPPNHDLPRITFEEPTSQTYMYGILSFFFGVIAFFIFAVIFRFLYKRYQRQPVHVHTFSGHQLPLGGLQLRSFLSPSPFPPPVSFPHNEEAGIPGLDLPPSYIVASELLDPPPSYEDISRPKGNSAQMKVTSL